jgi:hypothetical protein
MSKRRWMVWSGYPKADGLAHDLGLVIAKTVHGQLAGDVPLAEIVRQVKFFRLNPTRVMRLQCRQKLSGQRSKALSIGV